MFSTHLLQDLVAAYDATVDFVQKHLASELPRFAHLLAGDDLGVFLEQTQQLLLRRDFLATKDATGGLSDPLLYQRQEVLESPQQAPGPRFIGVSLQHFENLPCLSTARLGDRDELSVSLFEFLFGLLTFAPGDPVQLLAYAPDALRLRVRKASLLRRPATSAGNTFFARLSRRLNTLTPSPNKALSVG